MAAVAPLADVACRKQRCKPLQMKLMLALCLTAIMTASGGQTRPGGEPLPSGLMDEIERKISALPCIGSLAKWDRRYSYKAWMEGTVFHLDTMAIEFVYAEAGRFEFRSGRQFIIDPPGPIIDDRSYKVAYGEFDLNTDRVTLKDCGLNMPAD